MSTENNQICPLCGKTVTWGAIKHRNEDYVNIAFHSNCIKKKFLEDKLDPLDCLRILNIPYVDSLWKTVKDSGNFTKNEAMITEYIRVIGPRTMYKEFIHSEFKGFNKGGSFEPTALMVERWGPKLLDEEYIFLEDAYNQLVKLKEPTTQNEDSRYIQNAWLNKRLKEALMSGSPSDIKNMQQAYESDLKAIGLDAASVFGRDQQLTLGQRISFWEENAPIPDIGKEFVDVDRIFKYIEKFFRKPVARNFNKLNPSEENDINDYDDDIVPGRDER